MGRAPCCDKANVKKGPWSPEEDAKLKAYIEEHGTGGNWIALPQKIGLKRCGKSCRLRWLNYLRPNIKHGGFSEAEDNVICSLYISIGSRWSIIAAQLPGRTDNDIKNYWNTRLKKKLLGKQRKEQQARRGSFKQEIKRESESLEIPAGVINQQTPYWPELPAILPGLNSYQDAPPLMDQESILRNLLAKLGGRFSDDLRESSNPTTNYHLDGSCRQDPLYGNSIDMLSSSNSMNSIESPCSQLANAQYSTIVNGAGADMFQGPGDFRVELEEMAYSNQQQMEGLESFYGTIDMANSSTTGACSGESSTWRNTGPSLGYLVPQYESCLQSTAQDSSFANSIYFGPHQHC